MLTRAFLRTSLPVPHDDWNRGGHRLGRFLDRIICLVGMARFPHEFVHRKMRPNAQQERGESRCIAPHARQCAAGKKKPRKGQQHDDATRHHTVMHEPVRDRLFSMVLVVHVALFVSFHASFAALQQGKVKDTNGYTSRGLVRLPDAGSPVKDMYKPKARSVS